MLIMTDENKNPIKTIEYTPELGTEIAKLYAAGIPLYNISKQGSRFPERNELYHWVSVFDDLKSKIAAARESHAAALVEQTIDISDNAFDAVRARNQIQARQWIASKISRQFADRVDVNVNHVSITAALKEARARLQCDPAAAVDAQVIDVTAPQLIAASDNKSDDESDLVPIPVDDDIFS